MEGLSFMFISIDDHHFRVLTIDFHSEFSLKRIGRIVELKLKTLTLDTRCRKEASGSLHNETEVLEELRTHYMQCSKPKKIRESRVHIFFSPLH